ncbi:hypothetical protein BGZ49_003787 [Haplosporangium sp. Z 27]|nr:hypothetical protein BGZ49_003787 [Haplosporangium sp. Z 27]
MPLTWIDNFFLLSSRPKSNHERIVHNNCKVDSSLHIEEVCDSDVRVAPITWRNVILQTRDQALASLIELRQAIRFQLEKKARNAGGSVKLDQANVTLEQSSFKDGVLQTMSTVRFFVQRRYSVTGNCFSNRNAEQRAQYLDKIDQD